MITQKKKLTRILGHSQSILRRSGIVDAWKLRLNYAEKQSAAK